jgi:hypothetical protein
MRIPEPPITPDDTQPTEAANPFYGVPPGFLAELEIKLRDAWAAAEQLVANGHRFRLCDDLEIAYKLARAERSRLDGLISPDTRPNLYPNPPTE